MKLGVDTNRLEVNTTRISNHALKTQAHSTMKTKDMNRINVVSSRYIEDTFIKTFVNLSTVEAGIASIMFMNL